MKNKDDVLPNYLGAYIKGLRIGQGLRLKDVSERSKVSSSYLNRIENGRRITPSIAVMKRLADTYDISTLELLQMTLGVIDPEIKDIRDLLLDGNYNIKGIEGSKEMGILLCEIIECITSDEWQHQDMSNVSYKKLVEIIKDLNKLL
jgi:transcriptional regulator with XRE-family HTH domain